VPEPEVAVRQPATRRSLARRGLIVAVLGLGAIGLFVGAGQVARADAAVGKLQHDGVPAAGNVTAIDATPTGRGGFANGSVVVQFAAAGQPQERSIFVGNNVSDYQVGQSVTVVYDAGDPSQVELQGVVSTGPGVPFAVPLIGAVLLTGMAVVAGRHAWQLACIVRKQPWVKLPSRVTQVPQSLGFRQGTRLLVVLDTADGDLTVDTLGFGRVDATFAPEAWVAGLGRKTMALAATGGGHVVAVRRV